MKYASKGQLASALQQLAGFRSGVNKQAAQHILSFLALKAKGVTTQAGIPYEERDDFAFFDEFAKVQEGEEPYFDPVAGLFRIRTHPHSNVATARKGTFYRSWLAGVLEIDDQGRETWRLSLDYLNILKRKVLTKAGRPTRIPAIPLGLFLLRNTPIDDRSTLEEFGALLRDRFRLTDEEFSQLFETETRPTGEFEGAPMADDQVLQAIAESGVVPEALESSTPFQELSLRAEDPIVRQVRELLADGYGGVIFVGPPGTSKSWYAVQVALALADGEPTRVRKVQFHSSFQYEQFVEGFVPNADGDGFELRSQLMSTVMQDADMERNATFVVLIDELSRSDPGRVFGELLTYMEPSRRDEPFLLASGREVTLPPNVVFLATMNSRDKSVTEIDDAFDRRMAKIEFLPSAEVLTHFLHANGVPEPLQRRVEAFFRWVQPRYPLGQTYFLSVRDEESLGRLWRTQLRFVFEKQYRYEPEVFQEIRGKFTEITGVAV